MRSYLSIRHIKGHMSSLFSTELVSLVPGEERGVVVPSKLHVVVAPSLVEFIGPQPGILDLNCCCMIDLGSHNT